MLHESDIPDIVGIYNDIIDNNEIDIPQRNEIYIQQHKRRKKSSNNEQRKLEAKIEKIMELHIGDKLRSGRPEKKIFEENAEYIPMSNRISSCRVSALCMFSEISKIPIETIKNSEGYKLILDYDEKISEKIEYNSIPINGKLFIVQIYKPYSIDESRHIKYTPAHTFVLYRKDDGNFIILSSWYTNENSTKIIISERSSDYITEILDPSNLDDRINNDKYKNNIQEIFGQGNTLEGKTIEGTNMPLKVIYIGIDGMSKMELLGGKIIKNNKTKRKKNKQTKKKIKKSKKNLKIKKRTRKN